MTNEARHLSDVLGFAQELRETMRDDCIDFPNVVRRRAHEAADLICSLATDLERTEAERDGLNIMLEQAQAMLGTRTRERDAAIADIPRACGYCKHYVDSTNQCTNSLPCACVSGVNTRWEWRGVKEG